MTPESIVKAFSLLKYSSDGILCKVRWPKGTEFQELNKRRTIRMQAHRQRPPGKGLLGDGWSDTSLAGCLSDRPRTW